MQVVKKKLEELKPSDYNPRKIDRDELDRLKNSITKFGYVDPMIWNQATGNIVGGHQRIKVLEELGFTEVDVVLVNLPPEKEKALNLALNKIGGEWDLQKLIPLLQDIKNIDISLFNDTGFSDEELNEFSKLRDAELRAIDESTASPEEDNFDVNKSYSTPKYDVQPGEVYQLGDHRLICGDATNPDHVSQVLQGEQPILMVTDPPYGVKYDPKWRDVVNTIPATTDKIAGDERIDWTEAYKLFPGDVSYVFHAGVHSPEVAKHITNCGFNIVSQIIWVKPNFIISRGDYHWKHEPIWYAVRSGRKHNWQGDRTQTTVWEIAGMNPYGGSQDEHDEKTHHATQKPFEVMARPIRNNSARDQGIYDPFGGSGTTLIACEVLKRKCYMIEIDPRYCSVILERWEKVTNQKAVKLGGENAGANEGSQEQ